MKHIFIINPKAGKVDKVAEITAELKAFDGKIDYEIYVTKAQGDGAVYTRQYLETHDEDETYRFYACGGDGSLHDVVNGAVGFDNAEVACYASGSGNDFVKNFGGLEKFRNLENMVNGKAQKIDLLKVGEKYCINILNYGFDGEVTFAMQKYKRMPGVSGPMAYNLATIRCFLFKMGCQIKLTLDDNVVFDGKGLLAAVANGYCYGGGMYCAPKAVVDDGLIDVCFVKKVPMLKAMGFFNTFKRGEHVDNEELKEYIIYEKCKKVLIESPKPVAYAIDGETFRSPRIELEMVPLALNFVVPAGEEEKAE